MHPILDSGIGQSPIPRFEKEHKSSQPADVCAEKPLGWLIDISNVATRELSFITFSFERVFVNLGFEFSRVMVFVSVLFFE